MVARTNWSMRMKMLTFYIVTAALFLGAIILTIRATEDLGLLLSALITTGVAFGVVIGIGLLTKAVERRFRTKIIE